MISSLHPLTYLTPPPNQFQHTIIIIIDDSLMPVKICAAKVSISTGVDLVVYSVAGLHVMWSFCLMFMVSKPLYFFSSVVVFSVYIYIYIFLCFLYRFVRQGSTFVQALALGCTQFLGYVRSAKLPPLSPCLQPKPRTEFNTVTGEEEEAPVSLASGEDG